MSTPVLVTACYDAATMLDGKGSLLGVKIAPAVEFTFGLLGYDVKCDCSDSECSSDCSDDCTDDCYDDECDDDCNGDCDAEPEAECD